MRKRKETRRAPFTPFSYLPHPVSTTARRCHCYNRPPASFPLSLPSTMSNNDASLAITPGPLVPGTVNSENGLIYGISSEEIKSLAVTCLEARTKAYCA